MRCGISTACFYPLETALALQKVADAGVMLTELFFNAFCEMDDAYVRRLLKIKEDSGIEIGSVHPCSSVMEGFFFASGYAGKLRDGEKLYRRWFEICRQLGSPKLVFHGDHSHNALYFPAEQYAEQFGQLAALGREYGVTLCHENVAYCRLSTPQRVAEFRTCLPEDAAFVLDVKQLRRKDLALGDMLGAMGGAVRLVHISDCTEEHNCLPPGRGVMDGRALVRALRQAGFDGDLMIEVYSDNFEKMDELLDAKRTVENWLDGPD